MALNTKFKMLATYALFMVVVVTSWTSCREMSGMSDDDDFSPNEGNEIVVRCYDGWTKKPTTEVCECAAPGVIVGQYECREIQADDWYSSMTGCLVNQGISFRMPGAINLDSLTAYEYNVIGIELPDTTRSDRYNISGSIRFLPRGEKVDSIQFYVPSYARLPYRKWPRGSDDGYNTGFHGVILNDSTLVGQFVFGPMYDSWEINRDLIFSECEAIIRKGRID